MLFCSIEASEYIADLWRTPNDMAKKNLSNFENVRLFDLMFAFCSFVIYICQMTVM